MKSKNNLIDHFFIQKALNDKIITLNDIDGLVSHAYQAFSYPSVKKTLYKSMNNKSLFLSNLRSIFSIKDQFELERFVKKCQKSHMGFLSFLTVPISLHDEIHELYGKISR